MEFGLDQLRIGLRPGSSYLELSPHVEIARTCSNLVAGGSKPNSNTLFADLVADLVANLQRAGIWPITHYVAR